MTRAPGRDRPADLSAGPSPWARDRPAGPPTGPPAWPGDRFTGLTGELAAAVPTRPLTDVVADGRRASRRRAATRATGSVAVALTALLLLLGVGAVLRPAEPAPLARPVAASPSPTPIVRVPFGPVVDFADPRTGYAFLGRCRLYRPCRVGLFATADGGVSWQRREHPLGWVRPSDTVRVRALGRRTVQLVHNDSAWLSVDAGLTWRPRDDAPGAPLRAVPRGAAVSVNCTYLLSGRCVGGQLQAVNPADGRTHPVLASPPRPVTAVATAADGTLWSAGASRPGPGIMIGRSIDRGVRWTSRLTPFPVPRTATVSIAAASATRAYVIVVDYPSDAPPGRLIAIHATADGGRTWTADARSWTAPIDEEALPDGRLVIVGRNGSVWVSTDAGRTFARRAQLDGFGGMRAVGGVLHARIDNGFGLTASRDGVHWKPVILPSPFFPRTVR